MLDNLIVCDSVEEVEELRKVTVTLAFEMKDGKCINEDQQALYDYVAPKAEPVEQEIDVNIENESIEEQEEPLSTDEIDTREEWEKEPV